MADVDSDSDGFFGTDRNKNWNQQLAYQTLPASNVP